MELIPSTLADYTLESYIIRISSRSRIIYWIIIFIVTGGIGILPFIYVDVSVRAPGFIQSDIEKQRIYSPFQGKIILTNIRKGNKIEKGDTLVIIDSESTRALSESVKKRISDNNSAIHDLENLNGLEEPEFIMNKNEFMTERYYAEYAAMTKSHSIQYQKYMHLKSEYERNEVLHSQDLIPDSEYENILYSFSSETENLSQILISQKSVWLADLMQRRTESTALQAELMRYNEELNNRVITAPVKGEIIQSAEIQEGTILILNQEIAEISPQGELVATCFVNPSDIGLINNDQNVKIQIDALNYNEWGLLNAKITEISNDIITDNNSNTYFRIKCKPERTYLKLKNGVSADLKKGMSFSARIVVTRRTLFNLLFDKADKWFNPYMKRRG